MEHKHVYTREHVLKSFFLGLLCFAVYFPVLAMYFCSDDFSFLGPFSLPHVLKCFIARCSVGESAAGWYRPAGTLLYYLEYYLWGYNAAGYHLSNLLLHILCTFAVYCLGKALTERENVSFLASVFFALHPAHTEAVVWIAPRSVLLATFFYVTALTAFVYYHRFRRVAYFRASLVCFAMALCSKEDAVLLPIIILSYEYAAAEKGKLKRVLPFFGLAAAYVLFKIFVLTTPGGYELKPVFVDETVPRWMTYYVLHKFKMLYLPFYMEKWILPWYFIFIMAFIPAALSFYRRVTAAYLMLFLLISVLPYVLFQSGAHRGAWYAYLPSVPFCLLLSLLFSRCLKSSSRIVGALAMAGIIGISGFYVYAVTQRINDWMVASELCRRLPAQISAFLPLEREQHTVYVYGMPHNYRGAYIYANGIEDAVRLVSHRKNVKIISKSYSSFPDKMFGDESRYRFSFLVFLNGDFYRISRHPSKRDYFLLKSASGVTQEVSASAYRHYTMPDER